MDRAKVQWSLLLLALCCLAAPAAVRPPLTMIAHTEGRGYVRLVDWARSRGLELRRDKRDEVVQLRNGGPRLQFTADSREVQVNGVQVWLSFPMLVRNGAASLSQVDLDTAIEPLLSPPRNRAATKVRTICLDPGHGGKDPGYSVGSNPEKRYALALAQELQETLTQAGFKVSLTRSGDKFVELPNRPDLARRRSADLFISLHFNAAEVAQRSVQGAQVFCLTPPGAASTNARGEGGGAGWCPGSRNNDRNLWLAYTIQKALTQGLGIEDRGVRRARFAVLRDAVMPAVLVEAGFMSHPIEGRKISTAAYRRQLARAIADGVLAYKQQVEGGR